MMGDEEVTESESGTPDASASLISGAAEFIKSGAYAVSDVAEAGFDAASGAADAIVGFEGHVAGGVLRGVGADSAADWMQTASDGFQDASAYMFGQAGKELGEVKDDVVGGSDPWVTVAGGVGQEVEEVSADAAMGDTSE